MEWKDTDLLHVETRVVDDNSERYFWRGGISTYGIGFDGMEVCKGKLNADKEVDIRV